MLIETQNGRVENSHRERECERGFRFFGTFHFRIQVFVTCPETDASLKKSVQKNKARLPDEDK